jgi:hypothetical protein
MHTSRFKDDDGREWVVIHNGDWSGDVILRRLEGATGAIEYTLPGTIIRQACAETVVDAAISFFEQWDGSEHAVQDAIEGMESAEKKRKAKTR